MNTPKRIQRRRTKGWRMPAGAVVVSRPSRWGNPLQVGEVLTSESGYAFTLNAALAVAYYQHWIFSTFRLETFLAPLRGRDLACWCPLCPEHADGLPLGVTCSACAPCHADVLLELANR